MSIKMCRCLYNGCKVKTGEFIINGDLYIANNGILILSGVPREHYYNTLLKETEYHILAQEMYEIPSLGDWQTFVLVDWCMGNNEELTKIVMEAKDKNG